MKHIHVLMGAMWAAETMMAATIGQVVVRQQWPWSSDVKVEYALTGVTDPVDISVECYNGATKLESATLATAISGYRYGLAADGVYALTIDPIKAFGKERGIIADFRVKLSTTDSSATTTETLYKIFDLTKQNSITDVRRADLLNGKYGSIETAYSNIISGSDVGEVLIWTGVTNNPIYKTTHLVMRKISAAGKSYTMGAPNGQKGQAYGESNYNGYEKQHTVSFTNDFYIAVFPTTKYQHALILGQSPDASDASLRKPVDDTYWTQLRGYMISNDGILGWWPDAGVWSADGFVANPDGSPHDVDATGAGSQEAALSKLRAKTGVLFDLPTEARWEYCCKAGTTAGTYAGEITAADYTGQDPVVNQIAWCYANSAGATHEPGELAPNPWGLYDMLGNVYEMCLDVMQNTLSTAAIVDPAGATSSNRYVRRIIRGTDVLNTITYKVRSAFRGSTADPHVANTNIKEGYRLMFDVH